MHCLEAYRTHVRLLPCTYREVVTGASRSFSDSGDEEEYGWTVGNLNKRFETPGVPGMVDNFADPKTTLFPGGYGTRSLSLRLCRPACTLTHPGHRAGGEEAVLRLCRPHVPLVTIEACGSPSHAAAPVGAGRSRCPSFAVSRGLRQVRGQGRGRKIDR